MATTEADKRAAVIAEARTWLGTPYHNCADIKGTGVDCGMLLVRVFCDLQLAPPFDPRPYPSDWHLHRDEERYLGFVKTYMREIASPLPGDVAVFLYGRCYSHGGIVTKAAPLTIVHAYYENRCVTEDDIRRDPRLGHPDRKVRYFSMWGR